MKAITCRAYGLPEVLTVVDVERPTPGPHEILVEVHASTVNSSDWYVRSGVRAAPLFMQLMFRLRVGFTRPRKPILGLIVVGRVVEVGSKVTRFRPGHRVWAFTKFHFGAYAEYTCIADDSSVGLAPEGWSDDDAAAIIYGGLLALHYLKRGGVAKDSRVLIYGASGAAGTSMVQLAAHEGAKVTAVCGPGSFDLVRSLGAREVLDYTKDTAPPEGVAFDVVIDAVGKRKTSPLRTACERALAPGGRVVSVDDGTPSFSAQQLDTLKGLAEQGVLTPCIDRRFPLEQIVEAHRYVEGDHKHGNVVVTIGR